VTPSAFFDNPTQTNPLTRFGAALRGGKGVRKAAKWGQKGVKKAALWGQKGGAKAALFPAKTRLQNT
jgi:hypothetical protein